MSEEPPPTADLPPSIREIIERRRECERKREKECVAHSHHDCLELAEFIEEQARIIHDLRIDSDAYQEGYKDGYEQSREDEKEERRSANKALWDRMSIGMSGVVVGRSDLPTVPMEGGSGVFPLPFD